ncbi:MAG TPA: YbdK family carboxylate-amine ligase [Phycisphaerales bacterium]|nr:YbdK family carboxylate-amine ligase [Phycisphaerales bacterium]
MSTPHQFASNSRHSIGVELELQIVSRSSGALVDGYQNIFDRLPADVAPHVKPEFMQSYVEIISGVCNSVSDVEGDLGPKIRAVQSAANSLDLGLIWAGSHPFSRWEKQGITPGERYQWLLNQMQDVARRLLVFGLHVHVGVDSGDKAIQLCDRLLRHIPVFLALSSNSPYWCGRDSGLESYRSKIIEALPTAGLPQTMRNWSEYVWFINHLIDTKFISSNREIWWDVRPHAKFGTVEMRVMDMPLNFRHTLGLTALTQSLIAHISDRIDRGTFLYDCHPLIAKQNKWHAGRYGMNANFVDAETMQAIPARTVARRLIETLAPTADRLGCLKELYILDDIIENGTGADRQRKVFEQTNSMEAVAKYLMEQAALPAPHPSAAPALSASA